MEYCGGGDLSHFIRSKQTLTEATAKRFLRQLALAMKFLRSEGIAHMDLKPQNILLTAPPKQVLKIGGTKIC
jgi:serine/threonine-protein kinase ULK/ATG1